MSGLYLAVLTALVALNGFARDLTFESTDWVLMACAGLGAYAIVRNQNEARIPLWLAAAAGALVVIPSTLVAFLALLLIGAGGLRFSTSFSARNGFWLISLAGLQPLIANTVERFLGAHLISLDVILTSLVLGVMGEVQAVGRETLQGVDGALLVQYGCTAFSNVSFVLLLWQAAMRAMDLAPARIEIGIAVGAVALVAVLNSFRMAWMSYSDWYVWVHDGTGATLYQGVLLGLVLIACAARLQYAR